MPKFRFLPEVTTNGIAFEAFGKNENQLLQNSALALEEVIIDTKIIRRRVKEAINLRAQILPDLLYTLLEHLIFLKEAKGLVFKDFRFGIERQGKSLVLQGFAYGEKIDVEKHELRRDIKAAIHDLFEVNKVKNAWRSQVILRS